MFVHAHHVHPTPLSQSVKGLNWIFVQSQAHSYYDADGLPRGENHFRLFILFLNRKSLLFLVLASFHLAKRCRSCFSLCQYRWFWSRFWALWYCCCCSCQVSARKSGRQSGRVHALLLSFFFFFPNLLLAENADSRNKLPKGSVTMRRNQKQRETLERLRCVEAAWHKLRLESRLSFGATNLLFLRYKSLDDVIMQIKQTKQKPLLSVGCSVNVFLHILPFSLIPIWNIVKRSARMSTCFRNSFSIYSSSSIGQVPCFWP